MNDGKVHESLVSALEKVENINEVLVQVNEKLDRILEKLDEV